MADGRDAGRPGQLVKRAHGESVLEARYLGDHLSKSQTVMISTSTTKTMVQAGQLAVGRSERCSLSAMSSLLGKARIYPQNIVDAGDC
jgi:hypothetical protein